MMKTGIKLSFMPVFDNVFFTQQLDGLSRTPAPTYFIGFGYLIVSFSNG